MPKLNIDQFDEAPKVGDKVKVMGKVQSIDEDSGEVEVSYDDVKIVDAKKHKKRRDSNEEDFVEVDTETGMPPESQSLDAALAKAFPTTQ